MNELAFETEVYSITFDADVPCVVMKWTGFANSRQFRKGTERMLQMLIKNNASKVVADLREMRIIKIQDQEWILNDFLPQALKFNFRALAFITSTDFFNRWA